MQLDNADIAILCEDVYEDRELWYPYDRLREAECEVVRIGVEDTVYMSKHDQPVPVDHTIDEVSADQFDGVVVPGGYAPDKMRQSPELIEFVGDVDANDCMVATICHAAWVAISAGIVEGREMTSWPTLKDDVENAGANWVDREMVRDGNYVTSRKPADLPAFCKGIIGVLQEL